MSAIYITRRLTWTASPTLSSRKIVLVGAGFLGEPVSISFSATSTELCTDVCGVDNQQALTSLEHSSPTLGIECYSSPAIQNRVDHPRPRSYF
jgi:hypothetical protein